MFKKLTTLLLAGALCIGMASAALAADSTLTYTGSDENSFVFVPGSTYAETDLFNGLHNAMPGDTLNQTITITNENRDSDYIKVWLGAMLHDENTDLSPAVLAALSADDRRRTESELAYMHDFLGQLTLTVWKGAEKTPENIIYTGHPNSLEDGFESGNVLLGNVDKGNSITLTAELQVPLELGNDYANRIGEVAWVFVIEEHNSGGGGGGGGDITSLTVSKVWDDDGEDRPETVTAALIRADKTGERVEETVTLSEANSWTYTWTGLDDACRWSVLEQNIPDGYQAAYTTSASGKVITITNTEESENNPPGGNTPPGDTPPGGGNPDGPVCTSDLTVVKNWDDDNNPQRPDSVTLQLYNGSTEAETITLGAADGWTYTWEDLAAEGKWHVIEVDIPDGYTPVYSRADGVVTITNTASLIDTGQLNWPVPVLGGLGVLVLALGIVMMRKKKDDHAAE